MDSTEEGAEVASKPMSAWNPFFCSVGSGFFGVDGDSSLPIVFADTYPEEVLAGDSVLRSPERFGWVLSPIEQRRLCDRQVFTPQPLSGRGLFLERNCLFSNLIFLERLPEHMWSRKFKWQ